MAEARIEVEGVEDIRRGIRKAKDVDSRKAMKLAGAEGAQVVAYEAQSIVQVITAALHDTIRASGQLAGGVVRAGSSKVQYAGVNHFGWPDRGIEPDPFLYDAADHRANEVTEMYYQRVADIAADIERRGATKT